MKCGQIRSDRHPLALFALACVVAVICVGPVQAMTINVLPVQVCDNAGANCANNAKQLYTAESQKIWDQAGITINWLAWTSINNSTYQNFTSIADETTFFDDTANNGISGDALTITMWFVKTLTNGDYGTVDTIGGRKVMIADNVFSVSRLDTLAHELGHNLGLTHGDGGMDATYLMTTGGSRTIPGAIGDITPDGAKLDKLTAAQITMALSSQYVVPVPAALYLMASALGALMQLRGRRRLPD